MSRRLYLIILIAMLACRMLAQDAELRQIYNEAESAYQIGRIEQAKTLLENHISQFKGTLRQSAYRLLVLCDFGMDNVAEAEKFTELLLSENPYYTPSPQDPQRFADLVANIKSGRTATITTASSQAENLNEVPVPTTLITEEMIRNSGASNLQEVLAAYVPGMTIVDCNDDINIAMRGIYSNGQEKILIMLNGHRLNSYCTNIAAPDFSISLDKLKQIEVLRGPASSLYGGVSLTAVVNLITKQGADVDGVNMKAGAGNYGQLCGSMVFGKRYFDLDLLIWGSFYKADGERVFMPYEDTALKLNEGDITIGGVGKKPSYDIGVALKYNNLRFLYNTHYSQIVSPLSMTYLFAPYDIDKYRTFNGVRPSFTTNSHHAELSLDRQIGKIYLKGAVTYDNSDLTHYQIISDAQVYTLASVLPLPESVKQAVRGNGGISRYINGQEHTFGAKVQGDWNYVDNSEHKGLLSFGTEGSYFELEDVRYNFCYNFTQSLPETDTIPQLGKGHESNLNIYGQLKHQWRSFILNAGLRFDYKNRYNDSKIKEFSPRLALIYVQPKWNLKLSYSKAFIDAPYMYRKTNLFLADLMGMKELSEDLEPEALHSYQLTFGATQWMKGLDFEVNTFYNHARNLIYLELFEHYNTGLIDTYGLELSGSYKRKHFTANLAVEWQKARKTEIFNYEGKESFNVPELSANAVLSWRPNDRLNLHTHLSFYDEQQAYYLNIQYYTTYVAIAQRYIAAYEQYLDAPTEELASRIEELSASMTDFSQRVQVRQSVAARFVMDIGAEYRLGRVELGLNIHNLLNTRYYQSGMSTTVIPQKGRWLLGTIAYKF